MYFLLLLGLTHRPETFYRNVILFYCPATICYYLEKDKIIIFSQMIFLNFKNGIAYMQEQKVNYNICTG